MLDSFEARRNAHWLEMASIPEIVNGLRLVLLVGPYLCAAGCSHVMLGQDPSAQGGLKPGDEFRDCEGCPVMVIAPAGDFMMGAAALDDKQHTDEGPLHRVEFAQSFAIGKFEVSRGEYGRFMQATDRSSEGGCFFRTGPVPELQDSLSWLDPGYEQNDDHPAVCVSWEDAIAYVAWLTATSGKTYRLPSEAEWEYAARAGTDSERFWGLSADDGCAYANGADLTSETDVPGWSVAKCHDGYSYTAVVGWFRPNAYGLHDVLGNVAEWVADCWNDSYVGAPNDGKAWLTGDCTTPILRGASWHDHPRFLRSANRYGFNFAGPESKRVRYYNFGFRVARDLP